MGVPKPIYLLDSPGVRPLALTDLFPVRDPVAGNGPAFKYTMQDIVNLVGAVVAAAKNGLIETGGFTELGQAVGTLGDPAILLQDREIPLGGFRLFLGKNDGISDVIGFDAADGIAVSNAAGAILQAFNGSDTFNIEMPGGGIITLNFESGFGLLTYDDNFSQLSWNRIFRTSGLRLGAASIVGPVSVSPSNAQTFFKCDTTAGNIIINLDPSILNANGVNNNLLIFKKISADVNTITLTPTSGTIQELGAPAASFAFSAQGESISVMNDGTNFFIV